MKTPATTPKRRTANRMSLNQSEVQSTLTVHYTVFPTSIARHRLQEQRRRKSSKYLYFCFGTEIDLECQLASLSNESSHSSLAVAAGTSNSANGPCKFNEESTVTYAVQQLAMNDRNRDRIFDPNMVSSNNLISTPHKPGTLRLNHQQHPTDFTVRNFGFFY